MQFNFWKLGAYVVAALILANILNQVMKLGS